MKLDDKELGRHRLNRRFSFRGLPDETESLLISTPIQSVELTVGDRAGCVYLRQGHAAWRAKDR